MPPQALPTRREWLCGVAAGLTSVAAAQGAESNEEESFEPLFNGRDLSGWEGDPLLWVVEDDELVGRSPGIPYNDFLATEKSFSDFVLRFAVRLVDNTGNSGVQFRSERVPGSMEMIGYQADIGPGWWGNLYDESRRSTNLVTADPERIDKIVEPDGYNEYEIRAVGPRIALRLNGVVTAEYHEEDTSIAQDGRIALQIHSGPPLEVRFRNLRIRRIER